MNNWLNVAKRRAEEIDAGIVELVPAERVAAKARALLSSQQGEREYVIAKVQRGLSRLEIEGGIAHQEVEKIFEQWLADI